MIRVTSGSFLFAALLLVILPLDWLISILVAALFHETCHILSVSLLNGHILKIKIHLMGCSIEVSGLGEWKQFFCILAGPAGSFLLLILYRMVPKVAICGFLQGLYNLLPLYPLDGGRLLKILLYKCCPQYAQGVMFLIAVGISVLVDFTAVWGMISWETGFWPVFAAVSWNVSMVPRKIPCKPGQIGVQ